MPDVADKKIIEAVAKGICRAYREEQRHPEWLTMSQIERDDEVENAWDLWVQEAQAAIVAYETAMDSLA